jgi:hypothetical protein
MEFEAASFDIAIDKSTLYYAMPYGSVWTPKKKSEEMCNNTLTR